MDIKIRLLKLGKKLVDLLDELRKRGYPKMEPAGLSRIVNGRTNTARAKEVLSVCENILNEWEMRR